MCANVFFCFFLNILAHVRAYRCNTKSSRHTAECNRLSWRPQKSREDTTWVSVYPRGVFSTRTRTHPRESAQKREKRKRESVGMGGERRADEKTDSLSLLLPRNPVLLLLPTPNLSTTPTCTGSGHHPGSLGVRRGCRASAAARGCRRRLRPRRSGGASQSR